MNRENLYLLVRNYFNFIGVPDSELNTILNEEEYSQIAVKRLPTVCIRKQNRNSTSNQSHIHLTGTERYVFYDTINGPVENEIINLNIINQNLRHLEQIENQRRRHFLYGEDLILTQYSADSPLTLIDSRTTKKIASRSSGDNQVQISNIQMDGPHFRDLRDATFEGDLLIFLQYNSNRNSYLTLVIPNIGGLLDGINSRLGTRIILSNQNQMQLDLPNANTEEEIALSGNNRFVLTRVTASNIANYSRNVSEESEHYSASNGNELRAVRTERHQNIVNNIAEILEGNNFSLYRGNIDCLAVKDDNPVLIFEIKTLDGTAADETNQLRSALSQLLYYERFAMLDYYNYENRKFIVFESCISEDHMEFLQEHGCYTLYFDQNNNLTGSLEALSELQRYVDLNITTNI